MNSQRPDLVRSWNPTGTAASSSSRPGLSTQVPSGNSSGTSEQFLSEHHLFIGAVDEVRWFFITLGALCLAAGGVLLGLYCWAQGPVILLQVGVCLVIIGWVPLVFRIDFQFRVWRVRVTATGLTWVDRKGKHHCTWDEVTAVYRTETRIGDRKRGDRITRLRLEMADGRSLTVNHRLSRYKELCETVQAITTERLLPRKRAELREQGATFGSVTLFRDGIRVGKKDLPWYQFGDYYVANGHVVFYPRGARHLQRDALPFALGTIPNYLVLLTLVIELGKRPTPVEEFCRYFGGR